MFEHEIEDLRDVLRSSLDFFYREISEMVFFTIESLASQKIAPIKRRVGVFGPLTSEGIAIIDQVAKKVSEAGFAALTAKGFYLPREVEFHQIEEILPPVIRSTKARDILPDFFFWKQFPRLVNKAIFYLKTPFSTSFEFEGCIAMGIPSFGFIIHENIQMEGKNCRHLLVRKDYSMCAASHKMLCPYFAEKVFCPFFDSENLPWVLKEFFMTGKNRLSAVNDLSQIDVILKAFIQKPRILNYVSKKEIRQYCQEFMKIHQRILRKGLNYKIIAIVSKNKGSLVFFEFVPDEGSLSYQLTEKPINIELMKLPQTAFGGDLSKVEFGGTNVVREHNKLIIIKGDNSSRSWSLAEARNDAFKEIGAVRQILSEGREKNEK